MTDAVKIALIGSVTGMFPSVIAAFFSYRAATHARIAAEQAVQTEKNTNSMKDALVSLTDKEAHARGVIEGQAQATKSEMDNRAI